MIDVSEERVDRGHAAEAGIVPFRCDQVVRAHHAAPESEFSWSLLSIRSEESNTNRLEYDQGSTKRRRRADRKIHTCGERNFHSMRKVKKFGIKMTLSLRGKVTCIL